MVGDALLDLIFAPEENDGVGMLIGEVNSSLPGNATLAHNTMQKPHGILWDACMLHAAIQCQLQQHEQGTPARMQLKILVMLPSILDRCELCYLCGRSHASRHSLHVHGAESCYT